MTTITKRILSLVLSFVMLFGMLPISALAEDNVGEAEKLTESASVAAVAAETESEWALSDCDCDSEKAALSEHGELCAQKASLEALCGETAEDIFAQWANLPEECQKYVLAYLAQDEANAEKLAELNGYVNAISAASDENESNTNEPEADANKPEDTTNEPEADAEKPEDTTNEPEVDANKPEDTTGAPEGEADKAEGTETEEAESGDAEVEENVSDGETVTFAGTEAPLAVVYAASDFQAENSDKTKDSVSTGESNMNAIIAQMMVDGYSNVTGALFCGDYTANFNTWGSTSGAGNKTNSLAASNAGANAIESVLNTAWGLTDDEVIYVQGNHDYAGFDNMDSSGANDTTHYGVYVLHEDAFQWKQGAPTSSGNGSSNDSQAAAQAAADDLEAYLKAKADEKYNQPIFVAAHVPLHFGYRTTSAKNGDNIYAKYIFDVLNEYGEDLDIIFLFGHNHSSTYDDYLGGGAVYLSVGDKIWVPNAGSNSAWTEYTLNFTYMNAGYVGYYGGECDIGLSSTIFEIYEDKVVIARYTADGIADLKIAGTKTSTDTWSGAKANTTVHSSTQSIDPMKEFHVDLDYGTLSSGMMTVGNTGDLKVRGLYNTTYNVAWTSGDESIATVAPGADGMTATVTAVAPGEVTITAVATETGTTRAVGDVATLEYKLTVVDSAASAGVVLVAAGDHTYFKKVNTVEIGKTYAFIDIEDEGYLIGQQQALHFNNNIDAKKEGDIDVAADANDNFQEINASGENVFQLPVGSELLTLADITNKNCWWVADVAKEDGNVGGTIRTYTDRTYGYLFAIEGDSDFLDRDADQDRIATGNEKEASSTGGAHWYYDSTHGLVTNHKTDGFQFALYYSQANTDFSAYRINHNGAHGDSKFNEDGYLANEDVHSRVYPFEQVTITLEQAITASLSDTTGYVNKDVGYTSADGTKRLGGAQTGDEIILDNGTKTVKIPVTIDMLSGTFDVTTPGTYTGLTVTYAGKEVVTEGYTLVVNDSATILKNDAAREYMDTIYTRVDKWYPGRQYLVVDTDEEGIGHAMGVTNGTVTAHNVLVQNLPVDGKDRLYIDASRYSKTADATTANLVGRGIQDMGNINEYFNGDSIQKTRYQEAIRLAWTVTQRFFPTDGSPEISDVRDKDYYFLQSQMQVAKGEADRTLYIGANAEDTQLKLGSQAEIAGKETDNSAGATLDWWWELWQYSKTTGVHLNAGQAAHAYLFYNWQNVSGGATATAAQDKNFQTEEAKSGDFTLNTYRRTWIYERVTNIDTISARISDKEATKPARVENKNEATGSVTFTGDYILVDTTHADGTVTTEQVPIHISMLSGTYDLETVGTYSNLTVNYQGVAVCSDYVLNIVDFVADDYPDFPDEGAVRVDKQLDTNKYNYLETGVASIDLSVTGIPAQTGVDLVVILDASSSMQNCIHGSYAVGETCGTCGKITYNMTRMGLMEATLESMLTQLKAPMDNGYSPDVDVAIATFNGYTVINSDYEFWYSGTKYDGTGDALTHNSGQQAEEERPDASQILLPFTNIANVDPSFKNVNTDSRDIDYNKGTNYDRAMELAYQLLKAKQEENAVNGVTRDAVVVFMSDGAPYQYNYFQGDPNVPSWGDYLDGTLTTSSTGVTKQSAAVQNAFKKYAYHIAKGGNVNKHWLAEAIKGDPANKYTIIDRHAMTTDHITEINGLGARLYSVAFGIAKDHMVTHEICTEILKNMATDDDHYKPAADGKALEEAFSAIAGEVRSAGNAVFKDQMGTQFNLVTSNIIEITNDEGEAEKIDLTENPPTITVKTYPLYKRSEIGKTVDGVLVTETMVGTRKPVDPTILETITFSDNGTVVSSDKKSGNILNGKVIEAATFYYNTDSVNTQNITVNGATVSLDPETFYWNIGDIPQDELVLSYNMYLTGSMEGTRPAGTYPTNNYADLTYVNYLGNDCTLKTVSPVLPWRSGAVAYAFYLVNKDGQPIINQSTGQIGSFEQSAKITEKVYLDFYLNSAGEEVMAEIITAGDVMPEGYTLFDPKAEYEVELDSNGNGYYDVTLGRSDGIKTTYVEGIESTAIQPVGKTVTKDYLTANTTVWFAVVAETKAAPDTVVIDYGLPVDISVLENDVMMGTNGKLRYVADAKSYTSEHPVTEGNKLWQDLQDVTVSKTSRFTDDKAEGLYGVAEVQKDKEGNPTGKLRYTLDSMLMPAEDTFVYAVDYTGGVGTQGYYYSTVTVIPATTIYYEDSFVTYSSWELKDDGTTAKLEESTWVDTDPDAEIKIQDEDRPGEFSLSQIDANNIYGYDNAYKNMAEYSMGSAKKVTVTPTRFAEAQFTFSGTGFDIVSLTSNNTGTITVSVYDAQTFKNEGYGAASVDYMVDTYYGYKYVPCEVTYEWDTAPGATKAEWVRISAVETSETVPESQEALPDGTKEGERITRVEMAWIVDSNAKGALYQVPVMKVSGLPYGEYTALITVWYEKALDHQPNDQYDFYLDAIRIYDPANDGEKSETVKNAYVADGEGWPEYFELRNLIISKNDFDALKEDEQTEGVIFIDNTNDTGKNKVYSVADYTHYGPNNELYLAPGQAVAFDLDVDGEVAGIHLAMKSVGNGTAKAMVCDAAVNDAPNVIQDNGVINTATDMYYDITDLNGRTVVIQNTSDAEVILSVTNVKVTYKSAPPAATETSSFQITNRSAEKAVTSLMMRRPAVEPEEPVVPDVSVPEVSEPEASVPESSAPEAEEEKFVPKRFSVRLSKSSVKVGQKVTVTVTTSKDVKYITVNGARVTRYTGKSSTRTWEMNLKATEAGKMDVSVLCVNGDMLLSDPVVKTVTVTGKNKADTFTPKRFTVKLSDSRVKVGSKVTVTVTTDKDVKYITVNGSKITKYSGKNTKTWQVRLNAKEAGEMQVSVVCYNSDKVASQPVVKTVTVTEKYTSVKNMVKNFITGNGYSILSKR